VLYYRKWRYLRRITRSCPPYDSQISKPHPSSQMVSQNPKTNFLPKRLVTFRTLVFCKQCFLEPDTTTSPDYDWMFETTTFATTGMEQQLTTSFPMVQQIKSRLLDNGKTKPITTAHVPTTTKTIKTTSHIGNFQTNRHA